MMPHWQPRLYESRLVKALFTARLAWTVRHVLSSQQEPHFSGFLRSPDAFLRPCWVSPSMQSLPRRKTTFSVGGTMAFQSASLEYLKWDSLYETEKPYEVLIPLRGLGDSKDAIPRSNIFFEPNKVLVHDARGSEAFFTLDPHGFQLVEHQTTVSQLTNPDEVTTKYIPEMQKFLVDLLDEGPAVKAHCFDIRVRMSNFPSPNLLLYCQYLPHSSHRCDASLLTADTRLTCQRRGRALTQKNSRKELSTLRMGSTHCFHRRILT